jgi:hypothetical protein
LLSSLLGLATIGCGGNDVAVETGAAGTDTPAPAVDGEQPMEELGAAVVPGPSVSEDPSADPVLAGLIVHYGQTLFVNGRAIELADLPSNELTGYQPPRVQLIGPEAVVYQSWIDSDGAEMPGTVGTPTIHLVDLAAGTDEVLVEGGYGLVLARDGRVAWTRAENELELGQRPLTSVVVAPSIDRLAEAEVWLSGDRFVAERWVGGELAVTAGGELDPHLLLVSGAGSFRDVGTYALRAVASDDSLIAVTQLGVAPNVALWNVATGKFEVSTDLTDLDADYAYSFWRDLSFYVPLRSGPPIEVNSDGRLGAKAPIRPADAKAFEGFTAYRIMHADGRIVLLGIVPTEGGEPVEFWDAVVVCDPDWQKCQRSNLYHPLYFSVAVPTEGSGS